MGSGYLIDTNVISELRRRQPEPRVVEWFDQRPARVLCIGRGTQERVGTGPGPSSHNCLTMHAPSARAPDPLPLPLSGSDLT